MHLFSSVREFKSMCTRIKLLTIIDVFRSLLQFISIVTFNDTEYYYLNFNVSA